MGVGKDRMQRIFRTLIAADYVTRETIRNENGAFVALEYMIRDEPAPVTDVDDVAGDVVTDAGAFLPQPEYPAPADPAPASAAAYKEMKKPNTDFTKPSSSTESSTAARARPPSTPPPVRSEALQSQIAGRLGRGDVALGWELLGELAPGRLDQLTAQQRSGSMTEESLARVRLELMSRRAA
jgi:hypothetical protein